MCQWGGDRDGGPRDAGSEREVKAEQRISVSLERDLLS